LALILGILIAKGDDYMIQVTATELKKDLDKYLSFTDGDEVAVTKNGITIAVISQPAMCESLVDKLIGIIPDEGLDYDDLREERILRRYERNT